MFKLHQIKKPQERDHLHDREKDYADFIKIEHQEEKKVNEEQLLLKQMKAVLARVSEDQKLLNSAY